MHARQPEIISPRAALSSRGPARALRLPAALALAALLLLPGVLVPAIARGQAALPLQVRAAVVADAATELSVDESSIELLRAESVTWADACLGAASQNEVCAQVLTQGYVAWVRGNNEVLRYHTDSTGAAVRLAASGIASGSVTNAPLPAGVVEDDSGTSLGRQTGEAVCSDRFPSGAAVRTEVDDVFVCISMPAPGAVTPSLVNVRGYAAGAFENSIVVEVLDNAGAVIEMKPVTVSAPDIGLVVGEWSTTLNAAPLLAAATSAPATIRAYATSAQDGSLDFGARVPVTVSDQPGTTPPTGALQGEVPASGGIALLANAGTPLTRASLTSALQAEGCTVVTLAVIDGGTWAIYIPGAPAAVNEGSRFPSTLASGAPFFVRCGDGT